MKIPVVGKDEIGGFHTGSVITEVQRAVNSSKAEFSIAVEHPGVGTTVVSASQYEGTMSPLDVPRRGVLIILTLDDGKPVSWRYKGEKKKTT